ncbi:uncharacterized protein LOC127861516 [Dreissena polymorpha]|uniref:uncharacterized protein LOC127861516 n=1 Tax=Dreissena polymorpha TaxID=45954 RepID=UPI002263F2C6|nr:uncharacterized protein LOC127861516 [Dreissena polymorpha]
MKTKLTVSIDQYGICIPINREKLFESIFKKEAHGKVDKIWHSPGHIFVGLKDQKKHYTFDTKTLDYVESTDDTAYFDINEPVLTVLVRPPNGVLVVLESGYINYWSYQYDKKWKFHKRLNLLDDRIAFVTEACCNVSQNALYWCERASLDEGMGKQAWIIYKRQFLEGDKRSEAKLGPVVPLVTGITDCSLFPMGHGFICCTKLRSVTSELTHVFIICTMTGHVDLVVSQEKVTLPEVTVHSTVTFKDLVLKSLPYLEKLRKDPVVCSTFISNTQTLLLLKTSGKLVLVEKEKEGALTSVYLPHLETRGIVDMLVQSGLVGVLYPEFIQFHSLSMGEYVCRVECPSGSQFLGCSISLLGAVQTFILSDQNLHSLLTCCEDSSDMIESALLKHGQFQSDALRLSYIDRMFRYSIGCPGQISRDDLKQAWLESLELPPSTKLQAVVEPFLSEYWKMEQMLQQSLDQPQLIASMPLFSVKEEVGKLLEAPSGVARQPHLTALAEHYPVQVLDALMEYLHMSNDELSTDFSTSEQQKWQRVIAMETSAGSAVPLFESMCQLLYKHRPNLLLKFLHFSQKMCDVNMGGVSAFSRRRHTPVMFERALRCFPDPSISSDVKMAVIVHAHVLVISDGDLCVLQAIQLLLKYKQWESCVDLLEQFKDQGREFQLLYQVVLNSLAKNKQLSQHGDKIFRLMPSLESCDFAVKKHSKEITSSEQKFGILCSHGNNNIAEVNDHGDRAEVDSESVHSGVLVFADKDGVNSTVSVDNVRPYLLQCLQLDS